MSSRARILEVLTDMYIQCTGKNGLIYFFKDDLDLKDFATTKEDIKKKKNKEPLLLY